MTLSRLQEALAAKERIWGGWVVGPTIIGPEEFAQAGYDYVGFDVQHGYLDDADVALLLRRLEHVPIATAVRLPSADPAPIGRVLDAGADAVIIAMVESAEAGGRRGGRHPLRARRGTQLRAAAGQPRARSRRARSEDERVRDDRDRARTRGTRRDLRRAGADGRLRRPGRPGDLAGVRPGRGVDRLRRSATRWRASKPRVAAAGLVAGIHAGAGKPGKAMAELGFRMITLASESQALRRGAAEHLEEAQ